MSRAAFLGSWSGLIFVAIAGCADHSAIIRYVHPTPLSRYGREVAVVPFENDSDGVFTQLVADRLQRAGFEIRPIAEARIGVSGEVLQSTIGQEQSGHNPHTCYRSVPELRTRQVPVVVSVPGTSSPTPSNPYYVPPAQTRIEYRTEQYTEMVERPYACTRLWRSVDAQFRASIRVITRTRPPRTVFSENYSQTDRQMTTGLQGSDSQDHQPPATDGSGLLRELQGRVVGQFAQYSTPRPDSFSVELESCGDDRCLAGIALVRRGDLVNAGRLFTAVVDRFAANNSTQGRERRALALFNRGVTRGFAEDAASGIADIESAIQLMPQRAVRWSETLRRLQQLRAELEEHRFRNETRAGSSADNDASNESPRSTVRQPPPRRPRR